MRTTARLLAGGAAAAFAVSASAVQAQDVKIGVISTMSGVFAFFGEEMVEGIRLAAEEAGYEAGGQTFELVVADDELNPDVGVNRLERLATSNEVDVVIGPIAGNVGVAATDWACESGMPLVIAYAAAEDNTIRDRCNNVVRPGWTGAQPMFAFGEYVAEQGWTDIVMIGEDYAFPHNQLGGFLKTFCRAGGEQVTKIWHPLGQDDFSSIIATMPKADALLYNGSGSDAAAFFNQYQQFGMLDRMPLLGGSNFYLPGMLRQMGEGALGGLSALQYTDVLDTEENAAFVSAFEEAYGKTPSAPAEHGYVAMHQVMDAIEAAGIEDRAAFVEALHGFEMDAPRGPVHIGEYGNVVQNIYINEVQRVDGELKNVPIETFTEVSQFGPFEPEEYMSDPRDTADFPPGDCSDPYYQG